MIHSNNHPFILVLILLLSWATGCTGEARLPGMPVLYPVSITVEQDGNPLAGATVTLLGEDEETRQWPAGGVTNADGVALIRTGGRFEGAAQGRFRVKVDKIERPVNPFADHADGDSPNHQDYLREQRNVEANTFIVVDQKFSSNDTPLSIEVVRGQRNYSVDVSPAVQVRMTAVNY